MVVEPDSVSRYEALLRVSASLANHRSIADLIHVLADRLHAVVPFEYLALVLHDAATDEMQLLVLESSALAPPPYTRAPVAGGGPAAAVWLTQIARVIPLPPGDDALHSTLDFIRAVGMTVTCWLPLTTSHGRVGVLSFGSAHADDYSPDAVAFMEQVAAHVAVAVDNSINFDRARALEAELRGERDRLRLLLDINNLLISHLDARSLLTAISQSLRDIIAHRSLSIATYDESAGVLRVVLRYQHGVGASTPDAVWPLDGSPAGVTLQRRVATVFDRPAIESFVASGITDLDPAAQRLCCLPLITSHGLVGTLNLEGAADDAFAAADVDLLAQVSIQIAMAVENALVYRSLEARHERAVEEKEYLEDEIRLEHDFSDVIGASATLKRVLHAVATVAPTDATVLILGETGTGKELIARAVHRMSGRRSRSFVRMSGAAIPSGLLESELFGYERGAFTGAAASKIGRIELADGGTLFLDEVGDIPIDMQPKLLRVLQEREFERLGSTRTRRIDVRVIAATNRDLEQMVADERFRSDLYYRLNVFPIRVPPLRERSGDVPALARYFVERSARRLGRPVPAIPAAVIRTLQAWQWPGNIRELENVIERVVILSKGGALQLPEQSLQAPPRPQDGSGTHTLRNVERESILRALRESRGVVGGPFGAAARLGMKRTTLQSMMQKLGIRRPPY
jgi:formate hydrogenlyase transcriptional activator